MNNSYESPFSYRYASSQMAAVFSNDNKYQTWRKLWATLARIEMELGLPISEEQVASLESHISVIDYNYVKTREEVVHHDVIAHLQAYIKDAPNAAPILALGATSCYVTDNADLILYRDALLIIRSLIQETISSLGCLAKQYQSVPMPGYTHYQPAELVTVGKRAALWLQDFWDDLESLNYVISRLKFLGCRGATGTEAALLALFNGESEKVDQLNHKLAVSFGFSDCWTICAQTYPRKVDVHISNCLSDIAQSCYKFANDIRLLQHDGMIMEPFGIEQIGSLAMPYKRNPMLCERVCSLSRYLIINSTNSALNASSQWLERSLDDSANRRITMPESFLCADSILGLVNSIVCGLQVNIDVIKELVDRYLPVLATDTILSEAVRRGGNVQKIRSAIRRCSIQANNGSGNGSSNSLIPLLANDPDIILSEAEMNEMLHAELHIGRCSEQVEMILKKCSQQE